LYKNFLTYLLFSRPLAQETNPTLLMKISKLRKPLNCLAS